jgi:hypothetical protein
MQDYSLVSLDHQQGNRQFEAQMFGKHDSVQFEMSILLQLLWHSLSCSQQFETLYYWTEPMDLHFGFLMRLSTPTNPNTTEHFVIFIYRKEQQTFGDECETKTKISVL